MYRKIKYLLATITIACTIVLAGCQAPPDEPEKMYEWVNPPAGYTGIWTSWYTNGKKHEEKTYVNGVLHGTSRSWYASGSLRTETEMVEGKRHGWQEAWSEDGTILASGVCRNGKSWNGSFLDSDTIAIYQDGILVKRTNLGGNTVFSTQANANAPGKADPHGVEMIATGGFNPPEIKVKSGDRFFALYAYKNEYHLKEVTTKVKLSEGDSDYPPVKYVSLPKGSLPSPIHFPEPKPLMLIRGLSGLRHGQVKTLISPHSNIPCKPGLKHQFSYAGKEYGISCIEHKNEKVPKYEVKLRRGQIEHTIYHEGPLEQPWMMPGVVKWVGDLNGDGKVELLCDLSDHYCVSDLTLFSESDNKKPPFVIIVRFRTGQCL